MPYAQVANLEFNQIKAALKDYLRSHTDFTDFDFEGSVWSNLLDVLAYNTYYTAFNTNMVVNELFLDSATVRDNVIAIAKQLGYKPKSRVAPKATISFDVNFTGGTIPTTIILKRGTGFITSYDNKLYQFVVKDDIKKVVTGTTATFSNIDFYEGSVVTDNYIVDTSLSNQRFIIDNSGVDTNSIIVRVYGSDLNSSFEYYSPADNILDLTAGTKSYFIDEIEDERYEIFFGDGILGRKLANGEAVEISYLVTNGPDTNGANTFTFNGVLTDENGNGYVTVINNISTVSAANGGADIESISKIKFNAPKFYSTQNRAVTATDYAAIVRNIYPAISDIIVFGGEDASPPEYGKVKIAIKPESAASLSSYTKNQIITSLKSYCVGSVTPEIVNPSIVYIELTSGIFYDKTKTTATPEDIRKKVITGIESYLASAEVEKFGGKFRYSKMVGVIDDADRSINSNRTTVMMRKDFYPGINSTYFYELCFNNSFDYDGDVAPVLSSTGFVISEYPTFTVYLEDKAGKILLYRLDSLTGDKIVVRDYVGDIKYDSGEIMLYDLTIIKGSFFDNKIEVRVRPKYNDIVALREMYLDVDITNSKFTAYQE